jgi:hypothetical protein
MESLCKTCKHCFYCEVKSFNTGITEVKVKCLVYPSIFSEIGSSMYQDTKPYHAIFKCNKYEKNIERLNENDK